MQRRWLRTEPPFRVSWPVFKSRPTAPTPEEIDAEYPDVEPAVRDVVKGLVRSMDWKKARAFLAFLLPPLYAFYSSRVTDNKVSTVGHQVDDLKTQVQRDNEQQTRLQREIRVEIARIQEEWRQKQETQPVIRAPSPRANPKGTPPQATRKNRKHRRRPW
jgi:hypothetical protein